MEKDGSPPPNPISPEDLEVRRQLEAGDLSAANVLFDEVVARVPAPCEDQLTRAVVLVHRAVTAWRLGRVPLALELAAEGWTELDIQRGDDPRTATTVGLLGYLMQAIGHRRTALELLRLSVHIARLAGSDEVHAHCLQRLGGALNFRAIEETPENAVRTFTEAAALLETGLQLNPSARIRRALFGAYGRSLAGIGELARAEEVALRTVQESTTSEDRWGVAVGNWVLATVRRSEGKLLAAKSFARSAVADAEAIQDTGMVLRFSVDLAEICAELGDHAAEAVALRSSLAASRKVTETLQEGLVQALDQRKLAVQAQRLAVAAQEAAALDPLTGLANRLGLERSAPQLLSRAVPPDRIVWLVLLDVDRFKGVNDDAGHAAGDATLREIAQLIRRECRAEDLVARWAGDEFVILLVDAGGTGRFDAGPAVAERIRAGVDQHDWAMVLSEVRSPTVSIGVATGPAKLDQLFASADVALYRAKRHGRNRVELAPNAASTVTASFGDDHGGGGAGHVAAITSSD